jgi:hypothetical protein
MSSTRCRRIWQSRRRGQVSPPARIDWDGNPTCLRPSFADNRLEACGNRILILVLLLFFPASAQIIPAGWKVVRDSKNTCQIAVPREWILLEGGSGAAVFQGPTTAIAVVTSQPGQIFEPLSESLQKVLDIRKEKIFENSVKRLFYQDKTSKSSSDPNAYSASVPGKAGTCSCHVTFLPNVSADTVKKIALSLSPVPEPDPPAAQRSL